MLLVHVRLKWTNYSTALQFSMLSIYGPSSQPKFIGTLCDRARRFLPSFGWATELDLSGKEISKGGCTL